MEYVKYALSPDCLPDVFDGTLDELKLDRSVLDERCLSTPIFLEHMREFLSASEDSLDNNTRELLRVLNDSLSNFDKASQRFILSLSGGVDSMCLLVLLLKANIQFAAVHIRHSSRLEDTKKELEWVQFVCKTLGVKLFYHHVQVARPHATTGGSDSGITRDEFEDLTRQIRFGMYRKAFDTYSSTQGEPAYVLIGHHLDDVDENRIAELGKGNLINIDGMAEDDGDDGSSKGKGPNVVVLRPLCRRIRKNSLRTFAQTYLVPHMHNSTPKWSKRGWIRDVLDDSKLDREWIIDQLDVIGNMSREIDELLEQKVHEWIACAGISANRQMAVTAKSKQFQLRCGTISLNKLYTLLEPVIDDLCEIAKICNEFSVRWNAKVSEFCSREERKSLSCPIQVIRSWDLNNQSELRAVVLTKAFQKSFPQLQPLINGLDRYISKKSVSQLIENLESKNMKPWINWKLNNIKGELSVVQTSPGDLAILDPSNVDEIVSTVFEGNREALKKTIASNLHRTTIS